MNINDLARRSNDLAKSKGWWDDEAMDYQTLLVASKLSLVIAEIVEAIEELRKTGAEGISDIYYKDGKVEGFPVELADAVIRIVDLAYEYGIPLEEAITLKEEYNKTRSIRHGGKKF